MRIFFRRKIPNRFSLILTFCLYIFIKCGKKKYFLEEKKIFPSDLITYQHYTFPGHYILSISNTYKQNQSYPSHSWLALQFPEQITKNNDNTQKYTLL